MDLKINSQIPNNISHAPAGRTEGASGPAGLGQQRLHSVGGAGADHIEISSLTEQISSGLSVESAQRGDRVRHLAALYSSGRYSPAATDISRALISHALGNETS